MAKQKKSQPKVDPKVKDSNFQKMIQASKANKDRLVFDKTTVNK